MRADPNHTALEPSIAAELQRRSARFWMLRACVGQNDPPSPSVRPAVVTSAPLTWGGAGAPLLLQCAYDHGLALVGVRSRGRRMRERSGTAAASVSSRASACSLLSTAYHSNNSALARFFEVSFPRVAFQPLLGVCSAKNPGLFARRGTGIRDSPRRSPPWTSRAPDVCAGMTKGVPSGVRVTILCRTQ